MFKRFILFLLALALLLSGASFASANQPDGPNAYPSDFVSAAIKMIEENWKESYFSEISMTIGEENLTIDGNEMPAAAPSVENGQLILPIVDIAQAIGDEDLIDDSASAATGNGVRTIPEGRSARGRGKNFATKEETERALNVEVHRSGNRIRITKPFQTRELIVQTKDKSRLLNTFGATQAVDNGSGLHLLQYSSEENARQAYMSLVRIRNVEYAEPNGIVSLGNVTTGSNASNAQSKAVLPDRWGSERIAADRFINYLETNNKTSTQLLVAVIDTGVDANHPFFQGRVLTNLGYNFVSGNLNSLDDHGHGTHVSGTIADCTPANVKIIPVKALTAGGYGTTAHIAFAIRHSAEKGAKVINMSLGGPHSDQTYLQKNAVDYAEELGALVVASAGNEMMDASYSAPASFPNVIAVAASDLEDAPAWFTNFGNTINIAAPGVDILSCVPGGAYDVMNGTSMAAPHVTAAVAMLKLNTPAATPEQLRQSIKSVAYSTNPHYFGAGILDFNLFFGESVPEAPGLRLGRRIIDVDTMVKKYRTHQLRARITPLTTPDKTITYTSDNPQVATVSDRGLIEIKDRGTAIITATVLSTGYTDTCVVRVTLDDSLFWFGSAASSFDSGRGTKEDPYKIATAEQLARLARNAYFAALASPQSGIQWHEYYMLTADIDLAGKEWISIGNVSWKFNGNFDGNGHVVKNMRQGYTHSGLQLADAGLFNYIAGRVLNLGVVDADQKGLAETGILATHAAGIVENCFTSGETVGSALIYNVDRYDSFSFLSGISTPPVIKNCYSTAQAPKGFIFSGAGAQISNSYYSGTSGSTSGISCYITNVGSDEKNAGSSIVNSFFIDPAATGFTFFAGAKTGSVGSVSTISKCYGYGSNFGGVMSDYNPSGTDVAFKPLEFFKNESSYTTASNWNGSSPWDFDNVWDIDAGYNDGLPYLKAFGKGSDSTAVLDVSQTSWNPSSSLNVEAFTIMSNVTWIASSNSASWLTVSPSSGTGGAILGLIAQENTGAARTGMVTISGGGITRTITVTQEGTGALPPTPSLVVSLDSWAPLSNATSTTAMITSNVSWLAASNATSWLTVSPSSGTSNGTITLSATANTSTSNRTGTIIISGGGISRTVTVVQSAATASSSKLEVSRVAWNPPSYAGSSSAVITSNVSWVASSNASSWLSVTPTAGTGDRTIYIDVRANTGAARTGTITISGGGITRSITVTQEGTGTPPTPTPPTPTPSLVVSVASWTPLSTAANTTASITSNVSWTASSSAASWLTISPSSGTGNGNITVSVTANTSTSGRTGTVTITGGGITKTITVVQSAAAASSSKLEVSKTSWTPPSLAGGTSVTITSNVSWAASSNASSWLTVSPSNGTGNGTIFIDVKANMGAARTGTITIAGGGFTRTITVVQAGAAAQPTPTPTPPPTPSLVVSTGSWSPLSSEASTTASITSNVSWTASSSASSWLTVSPSSGSGNGSITVSVTANTATSGRTGSITISGGGITKTITVVQGAAAPSSELDVSRTSWLPPSFAGGTSAKITSNVSWTVSSNASWLVVSPSSGNGDGTIFIDVMANTGATRTGTITITGGGISKTITVTQSSP